MKSVSTPVLLITLLSLLCGSVWADKLYLKNGQVIDGTIYEETDTDVKIRVNIGSIKENRTYPKSEIDRIEKPKPDDVDVIPIKRLLPMGDMREADDYRKAMKLVDDFLAKYPESPHREEVSKIKQELETEKALAEKGGIKFKGEWLTLQQARMHDENLKAERMYRQMLGYARAGGLSNLAGAMRTYERLNANYAGTRPHAEAVKLAQEVLVAYGRALTNRKKEIAANEAYQAKQQELLTEQQKAQVKAAIAEEKARFDRRVAQEKAAGIVWLSTSSRDTANVDATISQVRKALEDLRKVNLEEVQAKAEALFDVEGMIVKMELAEAEKQLWATVKKTDVSKNPYLQSLTAKLEKAQGEEATRLALENRGNTEESKMATAIAESTTTVEQPATDGPSGLDLLGMQNTAADTQPDQPASKKPTPKTSSQSEPKKPAPKPAAPKPAVTQPKPATGGGGGFPFNPIYLVAPILLVVTGNLYMKKKKEHQYALLN